MSVISITITQSTDQVVAGIPRSITISTNIISTIFYTLDGTDPTLYSTIYTGPIFLPTDQLLLTLKVFATNGTDNSPIIVEQYMTNNLGANIRMPHSGTNARPGSNILDNYPYGTPPFQPNQIFTSTADAGITVFNPELPAVPNAFDAKGNPAAFSNDPYTVKNYQIIYSTTNAEGEQGKNIGNLPGEITTYPSDTQPDPGQQSNQGPEYTEQFTTLFDPRAFVIFQDFTNEDPTDPPIINRDFMTLENPERARDGAYFMQSGMDAPAPSGTFIRSHYDPRKGTLTSYFRDSWSNRWIIATSPYTANGPYDGNLAATAIGRSRYVFEWNWGQYRTLF